MLYTRRSALAGIAASGASWHVLFRDTRQAPTKRVAPMPTLNPLVDPSIALPSYKRIVQSSLITWKDTSDGSASEYWIATETLNPVISILGRGEIPAVVSVTVVASLILQKFVTIAGIMGGALTYTPAPSAQGGSIVAYGSDQNPPWLAIAPQTAVAYQPIPAVTNTGATVQAAFSLVLDPLTLNIPTDPSTSPTPNLSLVMPIQAFYGGGASDTIGVIRTQWTLASAAPGS